MSEFTETRGHNYFDSYARGSGIPPRVYFDKIIPKSGTPERLGKKSEKISNQDRAWWRLLHRRSITEQAELWQEILMKQATAWHPEGFSARQIADWKQFCARAWNNMTMREKKFWIKEMPSRLVDKKSVEKKTETLLTAPGRTVNADLLRQGDVLGLNFEIMTAADKLGGIKSSRGRLPISIRSVAARVFFTGEKINVSDARHANRKGEISYMRRVSSGGVVIAEIKLGPALAAAEVGLRSAVADESLRVFSRIHSDPKLFSHADRLILGQQLFLNESSGAISAPRAGDMVEEPRAGHPGWCVMEQDKRLYVWDISESGKKSLRGFYEGEIFYPHADQSFSVITNSGEEILIDETQLNILRSVSGEVVIVPANEQGMKTLHSPRVFGTTKPLDKNQAIWGEHGAMHIALKDGRHFVNAAGDVFVYDAMIGLHHVGVLAGE